MANKRKWGGGGGGEEGIAKIVWLAVVWEICKKGRVAQRGVTQGGSEGLEFNSSTTEFLCTFVSMHSGMDSEFCVSGGKQINMLNSYIHKYNLSVTYWWLYMKLYLTI